MTTNIMIPIKIGMNVPVTKSTMMNFSLLDFVVSLVKLDIEDVVVKFDCKDGSRKRGVRGVCDSSGDDGGDEGEFGDTKGGSIGDGLGNGGGGEGSGGEGDGGGGGEGSGDGGGKGLGDAGGDDGGGFPGG